jgi:hypothetical protein
MHGGRGCPAPNPTVNKATKTKEVEQTASIGNMNKIIKNGNIKT